MVVLGPPPSHFPPCLSRIVDLQIKTLTLTQLHNIPKWYTGTMSQLLIKRLAIHTQNSFRNHTAKLVLVISSCSEMIICHCIDVTTALIMTVSRLSRNRLWSVIVHERGRAIFTLPHMCLFWAMCRVDRYVRQCVFAVMCTIIDHYWRTPIHTHTQWYSKVYRNDLVNKYPTHSLICCAQTRFHWPERHISESGDLTGGAYIQTSLIRTPHNTEVFWGDSLQFTIHNLIL